MKKLYASKTFWIAVLQGVIGVVLVVETQYPGIGGVAILKSFLDIALRMVTTTAIGQPEKEVI